MEAPHTPGPWSIFAEVGGNLGSSLGAAITDDTPERKFICRMVRDNDIPETAYQANARLIAAAPDLLAALDRFVLFERGELMDRYPCAHPESNGAVEAWLDRVLREPARSAIAKARGA